MKCNSGDSVHLQNPYSIEHKKHQQAFLALLPGKQLAKVIVELCDKVYCFITVSFSGFSIVLSLSLSLLIDAEQCMASFDLSSNFNPNPERIGRTVRRHVVPPQKRLTWNPSSSTSATPMAKTLREYSVPSSSHIPTRMNSDQGNDGFELNSGLVNMVQANPFCGKASEDANAHLQNFVEVSSTINHRGATMANVRLRLFPIKQTSLLGMSVLMHS